jgi:hypothetical protein
VSVPGAEPMTRSVEATPGVILVAHWTLSPEQQERLPSDTLRIHATNHLTYVDEAIRRLEEREPGQRIDVRGPVRRGAGFDERWLFHIDPAATLTATGQIGQAGVCIRMPPLTEAELEEALRPIGPWYYMLCTNKLELVDIEPVPPAYLERLLTTQAGSGA